MRKSQKFVECLSHMQEHGVDIGSKSETRQSFGREGTQVTDAGSASRMRLV